MIDIFLTLTSYSVYLIISDNFNISSDVISLLFIANAYRLLSVLNKNEDLVEITKLIFNGDYHNLIFIFLFAFNFIRICFTQTKSKF